MTIAFNREPLKQYRRDLRRKMTKAEIYFWNRVRNGLINGIRFKRQFSVDNYILDFYAPTIKLAVEIDGGYHNLPEIQRHDAQRETWIREYGIAFIRFTNEEVLTDQDNVIKRLKRFVHELLLRRTPPPC